MMYLYSRSWCIVSCFLVPYFPYCKSNAFMVVICIEPHITGSCPESTGQNPAVVALSAVLAIVALHLAVAILTIVLLYTSESNVKVRCKYVHVHVSVHVCYVCVHVCL